VALAGVDGGEVGDVRVGELDAPLRLVVVQSARRVELFLQLGRLVVVERQEDEVILRETNSQMLVSPTI
jgi:hypothetical protein